MRLSVTGQRDRQDERLIGQLWGVDRGYFLEWPITVTDSCERLFQTFGIGSNGSGYPFEKKVILRNGSGYPFQKKCHSLQNPLA